jgi:hypothetical protein
MDFVKMNESGTTTVNIKKLNKLILDSKILKLLEWGGVNNWEWYSESLHPEYDNNFIEVEGEKLTGYAKLEYELEEANKGSNT